MSLVALKVIIDHRSEKLPLPSGIPSTVEELQKTVKDKFGLTETFSLEYLDADFSDFFALHSTDQIRDRGTIKVLNIPSIVLTLIPPDNQTDSRSYMHVNASSSSASDDQTDCSSGSADTIIFSQRGSPRELWPNEVYIPPFSVATEAVLMNANEEYVKNGTLLNKPQIESEIRERLADYMFSFTPYPSGLQVGQVAEALVKKHPCLSGHSRNGWINWQYSLKNKMLNYRKKLSALGFSEVTCNSLNNKRPGDRASAKNVKKARKGEVVYLPNYPAGASKEQQELYRHQLIDESKKTNSTTIKDLMCRTFAHRRQDIITQQMSIKDVKERWPALFDVSQVSKSDSCSRVVNINETHPACDTHLHCLQPLVP